MKLKSVLIATLFVLVGAVSPELVRAQSSSGQPIKMFVGFGAGGVTDVIARIFADELGKRMNRIFLVENRPGASGTLATRQVADAPPNGDTLIMIPGTYTIIPTMLKLPYDSATALAPINLIASAPNLLVVGKDSPYKNVKDLVEDAKAKPGAIAFATSGVGTTVHFMAIMLETQTGISLNHIPYHSSSDSVQAVLGGHVPMSFSALNAALPYIRSGDLRPLGIASAKRSTLVPDVPTFDEAGIPNVRSDTWIGLAAPAKTPTKMINLLNKNILEILQTAEVQKKIRILGADPVGLGPAEFESVIHSELDKFEKLARKAGLKRQN